MKNSNYLMVKYCRFFFPKKYWYSIENSLAKILPFIIPSSSPVIKRLVNQSIAMNTQRKIIGNIRRIKASLQIFQTLLTCKNAKMMKSSPIQLLNQ